MPRVLRSCSANETFTWCTRCFDLEGERVPASTEPQLHDTSIRDRTTLGDPPLPHEVFHDISQCRRPHAERGCGVRHVGLRMTTQKQKYPSLEWRHANRLQPSSQLAVQLQHQFQECQLLIALVCDTSHA